MFYYLPNQCRMNRIINKNLSGRKTLQNIMCVYLAFCIWSKGQGFYIWLYICNGMLKFTPFNTNKIYKTVRNVI